MGPSTLRSALSTQHPPPHPPLPNPQGPFNSWGRQTYAWGDGRTDQLTTVIDSNFFVANYNALAAIDNDDGSNGYIVTNNWLLYAGTKNLMGYNKKFINNSMVMTDIFQDVPGESKVGETKPGCCLGSLTGTAFALSLGLQDEFWGNTCIVNASHKMIIAGQCNATDPLDGSLPFPMRGNTYLSSDGGYRLPCGTGWNLTEAQSLGVDLGSTVGGLPSIEEFIAMAHARLRF